MGAGSGRARSPAASLRSIVLKIVLVAGCCLALVRSVHHQQGNSSRWPPLPDYCSAPTSGAEGESPRRGVRLWAAGILVRHGDRSSIHPIPGNSSVVEAPASQPGATWACTPDAGSEEARTLALIGDTIVVRSLRGERLQRPMRSATAAPASSACKSGQLTPRGLSQHLRLGRHLGRSYAALLDELSALRRNASLRGSPPPVLYARSTDYTRTILSASALVVGLFENSASLAPTPARPLALHVEDTEARDVMHGVGLASSSATKPGEGAEKVRKGACEAATGLALRQQAAIGPAAPELVEKLVRLFGSGARSAAITGLADALYARACHDLPPPCGAGGCVGPALAAQIWRGADGVYCDRYNGESGGRQASRLSMLPLLRQIASRLVAAASSHGPRLILFAGHDTVVAPLLAALGGMRAPGQCRWPPYASHVVFELWRAEADAAAGGGAAGGGAAGGGAAGTAAFYVRLVYNGAPLTKHVDGCDDELCPLRSFLTTISRLEDDFRRECADAVDALPHHAKHGPKAGARLGDK